MRWGLKGGVCQINKEIGTLIPKPRLDFLLAGERWPTNVERKGGFALAVVRWVLVRDEESACGYCEVDGAEGDDQKLGVFGRRTRRR